VSVVDVDGDGEPDRAYVADVRGNLYRIDFPSPGDAMDTSKWANKITKIATLGGKVFFAPDVVVTKDYVAVLVGTGDREKPLLVSTADNFFMIKDKVGTARPAPLAKSDLTRVAKIDNTTMAPTLPAAQPVIDDEGCYLELATNGEKVVNAPFSIAGATYFGTNRPTPANATSCRADLGEAHGYKFPLFCSAVSKPTQIVGGGLPPSPVGGIVTLNVNGVDTKMPFIIGGGEGGSSFVPGKPVWPVPPIRTRQNWHIDNRNK
jgi:type IV pilus assembly protein PilY1